MTCYHPNRAFIGKPVNPGKTNLVWRREDSVRGEEVVLPCGQCVGCRLERSRQWAVRCMHEASLYKDNCFLTLTYNDENLPLDRSLDVTVFQKFMKRLRKFVHPRRIKFFHCGEYGDESGRPHYHALIFNYDFLDKSVYKVVDDYKYYTSKSLDKIWGFGFAVIGDLTFKSAAYVARYSLKKITNKDESVVDEHYVDKYTGVIRKPEYVTMSRGGRTGKGLAFDWYKKFQSGVFPHDEVVVDGVATKPPRYYDMLLQKDNPFEFDAVKTKRKIKGSKLVKHKTRSGKIVLVSDSDAIRLAVKEQCKIASISRLKRIV